MSPHFNRSMQTYLYRLLISLIYVPCLADGHTLCPGSHHRTCIVLVRLMHHSLLLPEIRNDMSSSISSRLISLSLSLASLTTFST